MNSKIERFFDKAWNGVTESDEAEMCVVGIMLLTASVFMHKDYSLLFLSGVLMLLGLSFVKTFTSVHENQNWKSTCLHTNKNLSIAFCFTALMILFLVV